MEDKCFCHLNGYRVKDAEARMRLSGELPMGDIKVNSIGGKNLFDSERWYNELHNIAPTIMTKETVDGIDYYKFRAPELNEHQFMKGEFKENTRYTLSCKARKYDGVDYSGTGFSIYYTDGTRTHRFFNKTLTEYDYVLVTDENKTVDYIRLCFENADYVLVRDIQLELGSVATEYAPYFELVSSDYINGAKAMGDIRVSSVKCKNLFNKNLYTFDYIKKSPIYSGYHSVVINVHKPNTTFFISTKFINEYTPVGKKALFVLVGNNLENNDKWCAIGHATQPVDSEVYRKALVSDMNGKLYLKVDQTLTKELYDELMENSLTQIEEGAVATEYAPYFELGSGGTSESVKGYYYFEMPIQKLLFGLNFNYNNEISDIDCQIVAKDIIEKITKDNVRTPHIIINNSLDSYNDPTTGEIIELPGPRQIYLNKLTHSIVDGVEYYTFNGNIGNHNIVEMDGLSLPKYTDINLVVSGVWTNGEFELATLSIGINQSQLATKKYVDDQLLLHGGGLGAGGSDDDESNYPVITFNTKAPTQSDSPTFITDDVKTQLETLINEYNGKELCIHLFDTSGYLGFGRKVIDGSSTVIGFGDMFRNEHISSHGYYIVQHSVMCIGTWTDGVFTCSEVKITGNKRWGEESFLAKGNTTAFTPTGDYHPATKKYVDDMIEALRNELQG